MSADFSFIKKLVKRQLRRRCKNALSTDWLPDEKAKTFPLRDYYSDLGWKKKVKRAMRDSSVDLKRIRDIFDSEFEDGGINLAVIGNKTYVELLLKRVLFQRTFSDNWFYFEV